MRFKEYSHREAKEIVESKGELKSLIEIVVNMKKMEIEDSLHSVFQKTLCFHGLWQKNYPVPKANEGLENKKKLTYDLYNKRSKIAVELEFTRYEMLFRDFIQLLRGFNHGLIDVGIIITLCSPKDALELTKAAGVAPTMDLCSEWLQYFYPEIEVPIYVLGICAND